MRSKFKLLATVIFCGLMIFLGYRVHLYIYHVKETSKKSSALATAQLIAAALPKDLIDALNHDSTDLLKPEYIHLKSNLSNVVNVDHNIRFAYLTIKDQDKIRIIADSEPPSSADYSPPGQVYTEAENEYFIPFNDAKPYITSPVKDRWGKWISVLVPIFNYENNTPIAVLGIDYPLSSWNNSVWIETIEMDLLVIFALVLFGIVYYIFRRNANAKVNEQNYRTFFDTIDDIVVVGNQKGEILFANKAVFNKLGYTQTDIKSMHILDLNPTNKRKEAEQIFGEMIEGKRSTCPLPLQRKNGSLIPAETRIWYGLWGGKESIFGISKDLSVEQQLLQKFSKIFDSNPALMAISSLPDRKFTDINDAFVKALGYSRAEIVGKTSADLNLFVEPDKQKIVASELQTKGFIHNVELKILTKSGEILNGLFSGELIESGGNKYFLTVMIDQTAKIKAETELIKTNNELRELNKVFVNRELQMIKLKNELEKFNKPQ